MNIIARHLQRKRYKVFSGDGSDQDFVTLIMSVLVPTSDIEITLAIACILCSYLQQQ